MTPKTYKASEPDFSIRAYLPQVQEAVAKGTVELVDVRSPQEFTGEILAPPGLPETCQRGGHIPGARSITWSKACNDDGTFKSVEDLKQLYGAEGITGSKRIRTVPGRNGATSLAHPSRRELRPPRRKLDGTGGIP